MRRLKEEAKRAGKLATATHGRKCRSILLLDSGHVLLSAVHADTVCQRFDTIDCGTDTEGYSALVSRIVAVFANESASMTRQKEEARSAGRLADLTHGRKCRSMLLLDSGHLLLSAVHPDTMCKRLPSLSNEMQAIPEEV